MVGQISPTEYSQIIGVESREEMAEIAERLYKWRRISATDRDELTGAVVQDLLFGQTAEAQQKASEKASLEKTKAIMCRDDYDIIRERGSPVVQGGLPSLGKRRP
jgi:ribonuclease D